MNETVHHPYLHLTDDSCETPRRTEAVGMVEARQLHERVITVDTHVDINVKNFTDSINYLSDLDTQVTLPKMEEGGLDVAWFIVYTGQDSLNQEGYDNASENAFEKFGAINRLCTDYAPNQIGLAISKEEVESLLESGKKAAMIGVENAYPMGEDLGNFEKYYNLGARYISLAHNGHSQFCDSHTGEADGNWLHNGLSKMGQYAVKEMNRLGIMIDVSHISRTAMLQIMELTKAPVIASHSSARALCDHSRNLDDEQLDKIRENGGVVQTVALDEYLHAEKSKKWADYMAKSHKHIADSLGLDWYGPDEMEALTDSQLDLYLKNSTRVKGIARVRAANDPEAPQAVNVSDLADHIDYMVERMGIDHVGISSDFDGGGGIAGWQDASETFNVTFELIKRGYSEEEIAKLWGGNLFRVLERVQQLAGD